MANAAFGRGIVLLLHDAWNRKQSCYLGDDNWPFQSPRRATPNEFLGNSGKLTAAPGAQRCLRASLSPRCRRIGRGWRGDENGIRYAIVASHDVNDGSLSPLWSTRRPWLRSAPEDSRVLVIGHCKLLYRRLMELGEKSRKRRREKRKGKKERR